ncbi:phosphate ABC transporter substrate-binding protein [Shewanella sp. WXL01]|uniref:Phosphate-binding protein n=1 Tax=Shewanella maritima TaxID=2520507 RepID=A0A411PJF9_9GAMM|nr:MULTISPECIES: phosphate ABC transporter substrate-binding protein [Shewanella]NKF50696.1 phosphate ABC transporter substrate-binding protein [Shewanella sp. WXL01]QBF83689.1 phosphate ABC transporter substrate-binding protein [Shewanella maritima]
MRTKLTLAGLLACSLSVLPTAFAADVDVFNGQSGTINIAGGTAHIPVMKQAAKSIMKSNHQVRVTIAGGGSGVGAKQVAKGLVDIGNTGRPLKPGEAKHGLVSFPFAIDGVAIIVNPHNPVQGLTQKQVSDIYAGIITNWQQVGGENRDINLFTRDEASGTRSVFVKKLLHKSPVINSANVVPSNGAMKTAIARDPGAIGYSSVGYIDNTVKAPMLDKVKPTNEACASGEYPVVRKLYMNTKGEPQGLTRKFIDYIYSADGAKFIQESGYIPVSKS